MPEVVGPLSNGDIADKAKNMSDVANNNVNGDASAPAGNGDLNGNSNGNGAAPTYLTGGWEWIDAELVGEAVGEDPSCIRDMVVKPAVAAGDNYCSCMWRVKAMAGDRQVNLIIKAPPKGEIMQDFVTRLGFYHKETRMLRETLPAMRAIGEARCGPDHILAKQLGPTLLPCSVPEVFIMEDLSAESYRNKERQGQLDMLHCKTALEALARFHALSLALKREDPTSLESYKEALFVRSENAEDEKMTRLHSSMQLHRFGDAIEKWELTKDKGYGEKIHRLAEVVFDKICDLVTPTEGAINVLNHGDFWINNMMFLYDPEDVDSNNPKDIRIIDLQIVRFGSPALDLQYFIVTSAREEVRLHHLDELLQHYMDHFNEYVTAVGHEDARWASLDALRDEFLDKSVFGFSAVYTVLCAVVAQPEDRLQLDSMTKENMHEADISSKAWSGKVFQRLVPGLLEYYDKIGVLK